MPVELGKIRTISAIVDFEIDLIAHPGVAESIGFIILKQHRYDAVSNTEGSQTLLVAFQVNHDSVVDT